MNKNTAAFHIQVPDYCKFKPGVSSLLDIGSGLGGVVDVAAFMLPWAACVGLEICMDQHAASIYALKRIQAKKFPLLAPVLFRLCDALTLTDISEFTHVYSFVGDVSLLPHVAYLLANSLHAVFALITLPDATELFHTGLVDANDPSNFVVYPHFAMSGSRKCYPAFGIFLTPEVKARVRRLCPPNNRADTPLPTQEVMTCQATADVDHQKYLGQYEASTTRAPFLEGFIKRPIEDKFVPGADAGAGAASAGKKKRKRQRNVRSMRQVLEENASLAKEKTEAEVENSFLREENQMIIDILFQQAEYRTGESRGLFMEELRKRRALAQQNKSTGEARRALGF
jgi:hypothetical protein